MSYRNLPELSECPPCVSRFEVYVNQLAYCKNAHKTLLIGEIINT